MRIAALALHGNAGWPDAGVSQLDAGLNVFFGPPAAGKTAVADLVAHALCGRRFATTTTSDPPPTPEGELVVESTGHQFRLRRYLDNTNADRLTVAALDGAAVTSDTVRELVYGLSPSLLGPIYTLNFRETLRPETLLSPGFTQEFRSAFCGPMQPPNDAAGEWQPIYARIRALEWELTTLTAALGYRRRRQQVVRKPKPTASNTNRASYFLGKLTDGELVRLQLRHQRRGALVVNRAGKVATLETITSAQRDQVYLSIALALVSACAERGVQLPLVLDEPFVKLDRRGTFALATLLDAFARRGHQVLVFTARREAVERFAKLGTTTHDMLAITHSRVEPAFAVVAGNTTTNEPTTRRRTNTRVVKRKRRQAG